MAPYFNGIIAFTVSDPNVLEDDITAQIGFEPTEVVRKGKAVSSFRNAPHSVWCYKSMFEDTNFNAVVLSFSQHLLSVKDNITHALTKYEQVEIGLYISTLYGQFGFGFAHNELSKLAELGVNVNFHFLSYGDVIKEHGRPRTNILGL